MYVILAKEDNSLTASVKNRIVQRSNLVDELWFLVPPMYDGIDMSNAVVVMKYKLPISNEYKTTVLRRSEEGYKEYMKYLLPTNDRVGIDITKYAGDVELYLTFIYVDMDENGNGIQRVRNTLTATIKVLPVPKWSDIIPDAALDAVDQRIIKVDAQIKALNDLSTVIGNNMVDNLVYNDSEETLYLTANNVVVGDKVSVRNMLDEGIPVVDMNDVDNPGFGDGCICDCNCWDNVVEFGYEPNQDESGCKCGCGDNVVEFDDSSVAVASDSNVTLF